jgi:hypothetical protein
MQQIELEKISLPGDFFKYSISYVTLALFRQDLPHLPLFRELFREVGQAKKLCVCRAIENPC